jgi:hypothetical protein
VEKIDLMLAEPVASIFELVRSNPGVVEETCYIDFRVFLIQIFNEVLNNSAIV